MGGKYGLLDGRMMLQLSLVLCARLMEQLSKTDPTHVQREPETSQDMPAGKGEGANKKSGGDIEGPEVALPFHFI